MSLAYTEKISFQVAPNQIHQVLSPAGEIVGAIPPLSPEAMVGLYRWMVLGRTYSNRMVTLQRQGRMGTFAPINGQEAAMVGMAAPLKPDDWFIASYREAIGYMIKGVPILAQFKQWGGYLADDYPRESNCLPFQVVLGTQMLHAVGIAQAIQYHHKPDVVLAACGDGATSEGDFNEALNLAGVYQAPVVFVVQNNGWAISTPRERQTAAETIAQRGPGFGLPGVVVDGNDVLAVYQVVAEAIAQARAGGGPTLIEAITYRMGAHTTADDPTKYRSEASLERWRQRDPISRFRTFLLEQAWLSEADDQQLGSEVEAEIQATVAAYEALPPLDPQRLFEVVYATAPPQLRRQEAALLRDLDMEVA
jgi:pyruvate dehydrogenase E1 component alpha subunit